MTCGPPYAYPIINGAPPSGGAASAQGAPGWQVAYENRFYELPDDGPVASGPVVLGDRTWTLANAGANGTFVVASGDPTGGGAGGLAMFATAVSTQYTSGTRDALAVSISLATLMPGYDPHLDYYFQILVGASNADASAENVRLCLVGDAGAPASSVNRLKGVYHGFAGAPSGIGVATDATNLTSTGFSIATYNVIGFHTGGHMGNSLVCSCGVWDDPGEQWPEMSTLRSAVAQTVAGTAFLNTMNDPVNNRLVIAAPTGNVTGTFAVTVGAIRVLVR